MFTRLRDRARTWLVLAIQSAIARSSSRRAPSYEELSAEAPPVSRARGFLLAGCDREDRRIATRSGTFSADAGPAMASIVIGPVAFS